MRPSCETIVVVLKLVVQVRYPLYLFGIKRKPRSTTGFYRTRAARRSQNISVRAATNKTPSATPSLIKRKYLS